MREPQDRNGRAVRVGSRVRLLRISGNWINEIPPEEQTDVLSMIGDTFEVEEIDQYGQPWIRKSWPQPAEGKCHSHSIALEPEEIELIAEDASATL